MHESIRFYSDVDVVVGTISPDGNGYKFNSLMAGVSDIPSTSRQSILRHLYKQFPSGYVAGV